MNTLSSKQKAELRSVAQTLRPALHVGRQGLAEGTVLELRKTFQRDELVKVAFKANREELPALISEVERLTESECVGGVGKRRSFYRKAGVPSQISNPARQEVNAGGEASPD